MGLIWIFEGVRFEGTLECIFLAQVPSDLKSC